MEFSVLKVQMIALADDPAITDVQAGIWINANYRTLLREREWVFMVGTGSYTVTSGTQETLFTAFTTAITDFAKPFRVWLGDTRLTPINYEERLIPGLTNSYYITPNNLSIGLVPTPTNSTDVVTVDYLKQGQDLDDSTNTTPVFLSDFHWILIFKALMNYQFQQREQSDEFRIQYEEILNSMVAFYFNTEAGTTVRLSRGEDRIMRTGTANPLNLR